MKKAAAGLLVLGLLQMTGEVLRLPVLRGIGAASAASPAPKVFSAVRGLETYSTKFFLEWTDPRGVGHSLALTPEVYRRIRGPYNRRNAYGAVMAYGPVLRADARTRPMFDSVAHFALCGSAPLLHELMRDPAPTPAEGIRVRLEPLATTPPDLVRLFEVKCGLQPQSH